MGDEQFFIEADNNLWDFGGGFSSTFAQRMGTQLRRRPDFMQVEVGVVDKGYGEEMCKMNSAWQFLRIYIYSTVNE